MANIGSSPLGLTFYSNAEQAKRSSVKGYRNLQKKEIKESGDNNLYKSLFGNSGFAAFPEQINDQGPKADGAVTKLKSSNRFHSTEIYDTSIPSIISYTSKYPAMKLLAADFAYLKDVGVYPNNRLIVARRFAAPVKDDLTVYNARSAPSPLSTLVSWIPDGDDFISVSFGEKWTDAKASFKEVLNDIGSEMKMSADNKMEKLGDVGAAALNMIPLPGFMESLQYKILEKLGLSDDKSVSGLPGGNPNLIREAKQRQTLDAEAAGSGLSAKISIKMEVEYEQKFINGVDPTLVYYDIISNVLSFGTSDANFQFTGKFGAAVNDTIKLLMSGDLKKIGQAISNLITSLTDAILEVGKDLVAKLIDPPKENQPTVTAQDLKDTFEKIYKGTIGAVIGKYKVRIQGIANALSGAYSTPWHVTIGNPKKPLFSSADMLVEDVTMSMGPILAFNDLPSSIKVEFTLTNARNLGAQEIFNKFNSSGGRTYKRLNLSYVESNVISSGSSPDYQTNKTQPQSTDAIQSSDQDVIYREDADQFEQLTNVQAQQNAQTRQGTSGVVDTNLQGDTPIEDTTENPTTNSNDEAKLLAETNAKPE